MVSSYILRGWLLHIISNHDPTSLYDILSVFVHIQCRRVMAQFCALAWCRGAVFIHII